MNILLTKRALAPIITVIILIVIGTIVVIGVLSWGKNFTTDSLSKTTSFGNLSVSDAESFIYLKGLKDGVLAFNYNPPDSIKDEITITHYKLANISGMTPIELETPVTLTPNSQNVIYLDCLYAYSVTGEVKLKLITSDNKYIDLKVRDPDLICNSGGTGTEEDPIIICNAEELDAVRLDLDADYVLDKDIDLQCYSRQTEEGWSPIIGEEEAFTGSFNGQNHEIKNIYINRPETTYVGLFGYVSYGGLRDIKLIDANITGNSYVGGLIGYGGGEEFTIISDSYVTGYIMGLSSVGGLIGYNSYGDISNSYSSATVSGGDNVGGLIGFNGGSITESYSEGEVSGINQTGGLVGNNSGTISNSYSTSDVNEGEYIGGLVGINYGEISDCQASGSIFGTVYIGGLVGHNYIWGDISNSTADGNVVGGNIVGCLIGSTYEDLVLDENSTGTGSYNCTEADCYEDCPVALTQLIH